MFSGNLIYTKKTSEADSSFSLISRGLKRIQRRRQGVVEFTPEEAQQLVDLIALSPEKDTPATVSALKKIVSSLKS